MVIEIFEDVYYSNSELHGGKMSITAPGGKEVGTANVTSYRMDGSGARVILWIDIPDFSPSYLGCTPWIKESYLNGRLTLAISTVPDPAPGERTLLQHLIEYRLKSFLD